MDKQSQENIDKLLNHWGLSDREKELVILMSQGHTTQKQLAEQLHISPLTVRNHLENVYKKSGSSNKCDLMVMLFNGLLSEFSQLKTYVQDTSILVLDDEEKICSNMKASLELKNYPTDTLTDASKLKETLRQKSYDFVIMDINMPPLDKSGLELLKEVRSEFDHVHFILMSGDYRYNTEGAMDVGAIKFLEKPFKVDEVIDVITAMQVDDLQKRYETFYASQNIAKTLDENFELEISYLGKGGLFIPMNDDHIQGHNFQAGQIISFEYTVPNTELKLVKTVGKIHWVRESQPGKQAGLGIEVLFIPEDFVSKYKEVIANHKIYSFIPSPH
jgi:DNA-binding NarL/FixJ family response regulator